MGAVARAALLATVFLATVLQAAEEKAVVRGWVVGDAELRAGLTASLERVEAPLERAAAWRAGIAQTSVSSTAVSDHGTFILEAPEPGDYELVITGPKVVSGRFELPALIGDRTVPPLDLLRAERRRLTLVDDAGAPVAGATVVVKTYLEQDVVRQHLHIWAMRPSWRRRSFDVELADGMKVHVDARHADFERIAANHGAVVGSTGDGAGTSAGEDAESPR